MAFVAQDSPDSARSLLEQIFSVAQSLSGLSERGRVVPEWADPAIREVFVSRYRLMYRVTSDSIQMIAVVHGARDFERWRSR